MLSVLANIDGFCKMLLWLRFGACFVSSKGDLNLGLFLGASFEVDFEPVLGPKKVPKRARRSRFTIFVFVGRRFGAKTPPDVSGQISHGTFQGNGATGCFSKYLPKTPEISGNFAGTWSNDLLASSAREPR